MPRRPERETTNLRAACLLPALLLAAGSAMAAKPLLSYQAGIQETLTDNASASSGDADTELVTALSVGADGSYSSGRLDGVFGLKAVNRIYLDDSSRNSGNVTGNGRLSYELVNRRLFLNAGVTQTRRDRSLFGLSSVDESVDTGNRETVRAYDVSARGAFRLGPEIDGNASLARSWTRGGSSVLDGRRIATTLALSLDHPLAYGPLGWNVGYQRRWTENDARTGTATLQTLRGVLSYRWSERLSLRLIGGRETNDYESGTDRENTIRGVGANLVFSPRTRFDATVEKRFFGTGYRYEFRHSRPLSSLRASYVRDVTSIEDSALLSLEEIAFRDIFISLESAIPDETQREAVARALAASIPNASSTFASFVTNSFSVSRQLRVTASLLGARNVLTLGLSRSDLERLGETEGLGIGDDFSRFRDIQTSTITLSWSHKLGSLSTLSAGISHVDSEGSGVSNEDVTRRTLTIGYNRRIGARTDAALTLRRQESEGTREFTENAVVVSLKATF
ncbi:MAG: TIGR03016 family PEP-CTERM system-associated outer membrane protein [Rhodocyclaceae bacterium]|nr:TIGR03016 family PEP-CTERM system-associated outer membrane protein [Rhodocyclaceae bacterium]